METKTHIGNWDDSLAFRIPKNISDYLGLKANDTVICSVENGKLVIKPIKKTSKYTLEELLAGEIEPSEEISWGKPEGEEIW
jgi:antitoxin component of MazEF toxin-antitoxin module